MMIYFNCWFHTPITHNYKFVNCPPVNVYILCLHRCGKPTMKEWFSELVFPWFFHIFYVYPTSKGQPTSDPADILPPAVGDLELPMSLAPWRQTCSVFSAGKFVKSCPTISEIQKTLRLQVGAWAYHLPSIGCHWLRKMDLCFEANTSIGCGTSRETRKPRWDILWKSEWENFWIYRIYVDMESGWWFWATWKIRKITSHQLGSSQMMIYVVSGSRCISIWATLFDVLGAENAVQMNHRHQQQWTMWNGLGKNVSPFATLAN